MKTALITGITGQDGCYLARQLLGLGYRVIGTSRDAESARSGNLRRLGIADDVELRSMNPTDFSSVLQVISAHKPDELYNLAGQTSVGASFDHPVETLESIGVATLNFLEVMRLYAPQVRFYNACSSECFGHAASGRFDEDSPFRPRSPYAVAKSQSFWEINIYREAYGLFACSGILFNHESPLRHPRFVTRKVISAALRIANGSPERLSLGNTSVIRDWGWAPEYVVAMHLILQQEKPRDYVIATGAECSLSDFVGEVFRTVGLDAANHVDIDPSLFRPSELQRSVGNPARATEHLGWTASKDWRAVAKSMVDADSKSSLA
jgi:GDPmannose 4,6-dehydratase